VEQLNCTAQRCRARRQLGVWAEVGPNALRTHGARPLEVLARQFENPILILLIGTAVLSASLGEPTNAIIGLGVVGFVNEYRSERAVEQLH
jgi:P-type Mg2+ transporter